MGELLENNFNWNEHTKYLRGKIVRTNYALAKSKRILPQNIKIILYNSLFKCHLEGCLPIWGNCTADAAKSFLKMQKRAVRNIPLKGYNSHTDPIFRKLKILKFNDLVKLNINLFMCKVTLNMHPSTICNLFHRLDNFGRNISYREDKTRLNTKVKLFQIAR